MKKLAAMTMALVLAAGTLAGCSSGGGNTASTTAATTAAAASGETTAAPSGETAAAAETEAPSGEIVTLRLVLKDHSPEEPLDQEWAKQFNEGLLAAGINAQVELVSLQSGTYSENLALLLNSGDIPDIIYFQGGDQDFALNQKILEDLRPYVENSTYVKGMIEKRPFMQSRLENYPYLIFLCLPTYKVPVMRQDVLDQCAIKDDFLADPSPENYRTLMEQAKALGYDAAYTTAGNLDEIVNVFDQAFGLQTTWVKGDDGSWVYGRVSKYELEELKYFASLFKDGLLDNEYASNNWESKENKFYSKGVAIVCGTQGDVVDGYNAKQIAANGESAALTILPPAKGIGQGYQPIDISKDSRGFAISAVSEHKDLAFQVLEYAASPEGRVLDLLGIEGTHYTIDADGKYEYTPAKDNWYYMFHGLTDNLDLSLLSEKNPYYNEAGEESIEMFNQYSTEDNAFVIPADYTVAWDACTSIYNEFAADFVIGNKTEADWDAFVEQWNAAGGSQVTEYANTVLN